MPSMGESDAQPPPPVHQNEPAAATPQQTMHPHTQWMAMPRYPSPATAAELFVPLPRPVTAPHYPPQYMRIPRQAPLIHRNNQQQQGSNAENKTIWVGDLCHWMDESYLHGCFASTGELASIKVIRNRQTGLSEGYGFVEFYSHATAEKVLQSYPNISMPNTEQFFRLNWAAFGMGDKRSDAGSDSSIFVGDLAADVTDTLLHETFASKYPSVKGAKVVIDANTGNSKGYGFVRFGDVDERLHAMTEMNGEYCSSRPMRLGVATPRRSSAYQRRYSSPVARHSPNGASPAHGLTDGESTNKTIFVGGLDPNVTEEDLREPFSQYGEIVSVKIPIGKGCGFVHFADRDNAEKALQKLNGTVFGKQTVRLSWGHNMGNKQSRVDFGDWWAGGFYGGQLYGGYGYMMLPQPCDPRLYAAAAMPHGGYPIYGIH